MTHRLYAIVLVALLLGLCVGLVSTPALAQDVVVYPEDSQILSASAATPVVATARVVENRTVNGQTLRGVIYCADYDSRTEWHQDFIFPAVPASTVVQLDAKVAVHTDYQVENLDNLRQSFTLLTKAVVNMAPTGSGVVQAVAEDTKAVWLEPLQVISDTFAATTQRSVTLATGATSSDLIVKVDAMSGSQISGPSNLAVRYQTFASAEVCLWYGQVPARMGDFTWIDADSAGDQDVGEEPMAGVAVTWAGPENGTTTTGPDGVWQSPLVAAGTYTVTFGDVAGYSSTTSLQGDVAKDSNPRSSSVSLSPGEFDPTIDHGFVGVGKIGDRCWLDQNNNGLQDSGEDGVQGCVITVLDESGKQITTVSSNGAGDWGAINLPPGTYCPRAELPEGGYRFTAVFPDDDMALDSNADRASGVMGCTTLSVQGSMEDLTLDVGLLQDSDVYVASKMVEPTNAISGTIVTYTVRVGNNGPGTAFSPRIDDQPQAGIKILDYPEACILTAEGDLHCELADLPAGATAAFTYTAQVFGDMPGILVNDVEIGARGHDLDKGNNDYSAVVHINHEQKDGRPWYWYWLPLIKQPIIPEQPNQCQLLWDAVLHVSARGIEYSFPMDEYYGVEIHLPDGLDLPYKTPTRFWVTVEGISLAELHFNWRLYDPFYRTLVGMGLSEFTFHGGYPREEFDLEVTIAQWINSPIPNCTQGAEFEENIDP